MSNFEFLNNNKNFKSFSNACIEAEKSILVSPATTAILSRRALELAVKWVYTFDSDLTLPYQDNISSLIHDNSFIELINYEMLQLLKYIIKLGNVAVHTNENIKREEAVLSLHNLHQFVSWINYCYGNNFKYIDFNEELLLRGKENRANPEELNDLYEKLRAKDKAIEHIRKQNETLVKENRANPEELNDLYEKLSAKDKDIEHIRKQNETLVKELTEKRKINTESNSFKIDKTSELETRKRYADIESKLTEWNFNKEIIEESIKGIGKVTTQAIKECYNTTKNIIEKNKQLNENKLISYNENIRRFTDSKNYIEVFRLYKKIFSSSLLDKHMKTEAIKYGVNKDFIKSLYSYKIYDLLMNNIGLKNEPLIERYDEAPKALIKLFDKIINNQVNIDKEILLNTIDKINIVIEDIISINDVKQRISYV